MFDLASIVHKQTKEYEDERIKSALQSLRDCTIKTIKESRDLGTYGVFIGTGGRGYIDKQALKLLKKELK